MIPFEDDLCLKICSTHTYAQTHTQTHTLAHIQIVALFVVACCFWQNKGPAHLLRCAAPLPASNFNAYRDDKATCAFHRNHWYYHSQIMHYTPCSTLFTTTTTTATATDDDDVTSSNPGLTCMNCIVIADFPTPPPPTTTNLYVCICILILADD